MRNKGNSSVTFKKGSVICQLVLDSDVTSGNQYENITHMQHVTLKVVSVKINQLLIRNCLNFKMKVPDVPIQSPLGFDLIR